MSKHTSVVRARVFLLAGLLAIFLGCMTAQAGERLEANQQGKLMATQCIAKKDEMQTQRQLIEDISNKVRVKRVQLTPGNCYLVSGKFDDGKRYIGIYDPKELEEIFYIIK
ncbi:MAG: hypothetical protein ORN57_01350 [Alphaproteobacteria bacterium]|nr:hypothetical protein [Alphaproteobacteria bacterium]